MKVKTPVIALLAATLLQAPLFAGTTGKLTGEVKDAATGEALVGASIVLEGTMLGASADIEGRFVILNIPPGQYTVTGSAVGYTKKAVRSVTVSIDLTTTLNFTLESQVVEQKEVVITAERPIVQRDLTSAESRVDAAQISQLAVREVNDILSLQAGVNFDKSGGIHIRGGRTNEVGYWVDGISVSDVYDGSQAVQVDNSAIQELQVISGTFNAEYGQAMSGIVNIVTKDGGQDYHMSLSSYVGGYVSSDRTFYNLQQFRPLNQKDLEGSLSGPTGIPGMTFYLSGRYFKTNGWLYGQKTFNPDGTLVAGADTAFNSAGQMTGINKASDPVPMNDRTRYSGQFKLTTQLGGDVKFALTGVGSSIDYHDYNHDYVLDPSGDVNKYDRGYNVSGLLTHSLSSSSFYTVNLAFFDKNYHEYLYADPFDPRYVLDPLATNRNLYEFLHAGTNLHHFQRTTQTREAKIDFTDQLSRLVELKVGAEGRLHRLYFQDYNVTPVQDTLRVNGTLTDIYRATIPDVTSPLYQEYTRQPIEISAYAQTKLEYERMVVNFGLRFEYFNSRGKVLTDPQDPNVYLPQKLENQGLTLDQRLAKWYRNATAKKALSPRFGISYPITDRGVLHFSYGHFLQIPSFEFLYQRPEFKVNATDALQGVYGNADLKPQTTIMYEFGLQQQVTEDVSFDITGFYRDTRNWVSTSAEIPVRDPVTATTYYTQFINKDYANSRGITLTLNKRMSNMVSVNFSYTFQVAEGLNSNPDDEQAALSQNNEPIRTLTPLDWDQTHSANLSVGLSKNDWGIFAIGRYGSGMPYTPVINQAEARGQDAARVVTKNSRRKSGQLTVDFRAFKDFNVGSLNISVFLKVFNLLDARNASDVYGQTGQPTATPVQLGVGGLSGAINRVNTVEDFLVRPDFYTEPRQIQFGIALNY